MNILVESFALQRRVSLILIIVLCFLLLAGCERKEEVYTGKTNYEYDDQTFLDITNSIVSTKDGYYFFSGNNNLMFFDRDSNETAPVCSQINCTHENDSCDAYFEFLAHRVWYYDSQLYVMLYDMNDYIYYLSSVSLDGNKRERVCDLLKLEISEEEKIGGYQFGGDIEELIIHRGYAYYTIPNNGYNQAELKKIRLKKNAKPEVIYKSEDANSAISRIKGFENHIYFQAYTYTMSEVETPEVLTANMYDYNISSDTLSVCIKDSIWDYLPMSDKIYFLNSDGLNSYTFENSRTELIFEANTPYAVSYDGNFFYCDNHFNSVTAGEPRSIFIFDESFQLIDRIDLDSPHGISLFGDERYFFFYNMSEEGIRIEALNKSQIGSGTHEWTILD